jgi:hypothetical protein
VRCFPFPVLIEEAAVDESGNVQLRFDVKNIGVPAQAIARTVLL